MHFRETQDVGHVGERPILYGRVGQKQHVDAAKLYLSIVAPTGTRLLFSTYFLFGNDLFQAGTDIIPDCSIACCQI